ncbi:MAG: hypothetical protein RL329_436 [Bacteroidota bacterium]|jgi:N-glycosylase/DNA lyase
MVTNLETRKLALITFIATLQQEEAMIAFEQLLNEFAKKTKQPNSKILKTNVEHFTPKSKVSKINIEAQRIDEKKRKALLQQIAITEPIAELSKKERLLATFEKMKQHNMFETIENPLIWQKQLRDEWK